MLTLIVADVASRALLGTSILFAGEVAGYALVCLIFTGLAFGDADGRTIVITLATDRLPAPVRRRLLTAVTAVSTALAGWLVWFTARPALADFQMGTVSLTGTRIPQWLPEALIPLGLALFTIQLACRTFESLKQD